MGRARPKSRRNRAADNQISESQEIEHLDGWTASGDMEVTTNVYEALEGDEGFKGQPLVRRVYNALLARHQKKTKKENATAWRMGVPAVSRDEVKEKPSSSSTWTIPKVAGMIQMPAVEPIPPSNCWQYSSTNIPTKDSKFLSNMPFINNVVGGGNKFNKELLRMYKGKLHSEHVYDDWSIINPLVLPDFIRVLMKLEKDFGSSIFVEESEDKSERKEPNEEQLRSYYRAVVAADEREYVNCQPSKKVFKAAMSVIKEDTIWKKFRERYFRLARRRCPEAYRDLGGRHFAPNIDEPMSTVQERQEQMDSYGVLFCRQCFMYGCSIHKAALNREDVDIYRSHAKTWREAHPRQDPKTVACGHEDCCAKKRNENLEKSPVTKTEKEVKLFLDSWTANDKTLFNCYFESYKNYCMVSFLMGNKTCREVMDYHNVLPKADETQEDQDNMSCDLDERDDVESMCLSASSSCTDGTQGSDYSELESEAEVEDSAELCSFVPCLHQNEVCDESCSCVKKGIFCEASCGCLKDCKNRFTGCRCQKSCDTKLCPCFHASRECDPDLCKRCGSDKLNSDDSTCKNVSIQRGIHKHIKVAKSDVKGWGAFACTPIKKGEFIVEYIGELISHDEAEKRGHVYDEIKHTFLFELNGEYTLDAARIGNKARFINSSGRPNCKVVKMFVRGELKVAVRALKNIEANEELLFDYQAAVKPLKKRKRKCQSSSETE